MRRAGHLLDHVTDLHELLAAARRAARGKRRQPHVARFLMDLEPEVLRLRRELLAGTWQPGPYRTFRITDPKPRTISAAPFLDRVAHHALCAALEPVLERYALPDSFACRPGKGTLAALRRAQALARRHPRFVKLDVRHFFERADHGALRALLRRRLKDARLLGLLDRIIAHGAPGSPPGKGLPIGNLTSQHLANLYLGPLDHYVKEELRVPGFCRYMDDVLLFGPDRLALRAWEASVRAFAGERLLLDLREEATVRAPVTEGVPFLGFVVWPALVRLDSRRVRRLRTRLAALDRAVGDGTLDEEAAGLAASSLAGWAEHGDARRLLVSFTRRRGSLTH